RVNVAAPTTQAPPATRQAVPCTEADLRRPWPAMPTPTRIVRTYVLDNQARIDPPGDARPAVDAEHAWQTSKEPWTNPRSSLNPPAGGTATVALGYVTSTAGRDI